MIKVLERRGIQGTDLNIKKVTYSKQTDNIKWNIEKLKAILWKLGTRQGSTLSLYLFIIVLEALARAIRQKTNQGDTYWKGRSPTFTLAMVNKTEVLCVVSWSRLDKAAACLSLWHRIAFVFIARGGETPPAWEMCAMCGDLWQNDSGTSKHSDPNLYLL